MRENRIDTIGLVTDKDVRTTLAFVESLPVGIGIFLFTVILGRIAGNANKERDRNPHG